MNQRGGDGAPAPGPAVPAEPAVSAIAERGALATAQPGTPAGSGLPLIATKLRIPRRRHDLLPRRRLVDFLLGHLDRKLLLISAPAGWGKTTLLAQLAGESDVPVCWLALDTFDRDLRSFLEYFVAAVARRFPAFGARSLALLRATADPAANLYPLAATIVQELYDTIPEYFFFVLDDHHAVDDQESINEFLDLFVNYVDENCHLILASRTLPALPNLSLLVARRQAAGLGLDDLRFTPLEIQELARQNHDLELTEAQARLLAEQTDGWITGLLLTAVQRWEASQEDGASSGHVQVNLYDYLSCQVLEQQPAALRDFLLASSVLDDISPDLCVSVLGIEAPEALLDQVRTRNLFVVELEGAQDVLRYHALFREFLRDTLRRDDLARYRTLARRAAEAYAARGEWDRAVGRYLELGEMEPVREIIRGQAQAYYDAGRLGTLAAWIDALRAKAPSVSPRMLIHRAKVHTERGEYALALGMFDEVEHAARQVGDRAAQAYALAMKGYVLRVQGNYATAIEQCEAVLALLDPEQPGEEVPAALAYKNAGLCYFQQGQMERGRRALEQALARYLQVDLAYDVGMVHHDLGHGHELMGDLVGAARHYRAALDVWEQIGSPGPWADTLNGLGVVETLLGEYDAAGRTLEAALARSREAGDARAEAYVWASLGDLYRDGGDCERARQAYQQALEVAERTRVGFIVTYALNALGNVARMCRQADLARQQIAAAMELAQKHGSAYEIALCMISLGILASEAGDLVLAQHELDRAVEALERGGYRRDAPLARLYRAQVAYQRGDAEAAVTDLDRVLEMAAHFGFDQFLVVEGQHLSSLLSFAVGQGVGGDRLGSLIARIDGHRGRIAAAGAPVREEPPAPMLDIRALGTPRVTLDGQEIQWPTSQSRDLFFCLLQHVDGLRKEEVGALFWPDHPARKLDGIFRSTLYRLRRALFRDAVLFDDGIYRFNRQASYRLDVAEFETALAAAGAAGPEEAEALLEQALPLYRGDYLEGTYGDWCLVERERLRERLFDGLHLLAGLHARRADWANAIQRYQEILAHDPYRETAHRELMHCYFRLGNRVAAIRQYHALAELLAEELGLDPADETRNLYDAIVR
ncbi:MAG TPA: BTAD domain-containing putative transcriptional regulator [Anaerolineae bacterium]|nr:BTAD domain-containing putative transcriptional regulator [Anaerolineae bacterium]